MSDVLSDRDEERLAGLHEDVRAAMALVRRVRKGLESGAGYRPDEEAPQDGGDR